MVNFDLFVTQSGYLTSDSCFILFLKSIRDHFQELKPFMRIVVCNNCSNKNMEDQRFKTFQYIYDYLNGFNFVIFQIDDSDITRLGNNSYKRTDLQILSHGNCIKEYLRRFGSGTLFTLLTHCDVEFKHNMYDIINKHQIDLLQNSNAAAYCTFDMPEIDNLARRMDSIMSMWKTPILYEYGVNMNLDFSWKEHDGKIYDTGAFVLSKMLEKYTLLHSAEFVNSFHHYCSITTVMLGHGESVEQERVGKIANDIRTRQIQNSNGNNL